MKIHFFSSPYHAMSVSMIARGYWHIYADGTKQWVIQEHVITREITRLFGVSGRHGFIGVMWYGDAVKKFIGE